MAQATVRSAPEAADVQSTAQPSINVGTRKSKLALVQTDMVIAALTAAYPEHKYAVKARDTAAGDIDKVTPFKDMPVKNIWTHELETLMVEKQLDLLVHSLKDVPTQLPPDCEIGGVLARGDPRDALVVKAGRKPCGIADLPAGAVVGTSSIRRTAQIALRYPHLKVEDVRGNVGTRLNKLDAEDGPFDALILAAAGLLRLDLGDRIAQYLDSKSAQMLYAVGQGAVGIENRTSDSNVKAMIDAVCHKPTFLRVTAERSLLRVLEGGCSAPLGVETEWLAGSESVSEMRMQAIVVSINGKECAEVDLKQTVGSVADANSFGEYVASELIKVGAGKILAEIRAKKPTTVIDLEDK